MAKRIVTIVTSILKKLPENHVNMLANKLRYQHFMKKPLLEKKRVEMTG
jgi:hypothetical protein